MKNIKFLIADITCIGGIERVNSILANKFLESGYNIEIISLYKSKNNINYVLLNDINVTYINSSTYSGSPGGLKRLFMHLKASVSLCRYLFKTRDQYILIVNSFPMAFLAYPYVCLKKNSIVIEHVYSHYYGKVIRFLRMIIYKKYKTVVALTSDDVTFYRKHHSNVVKIENPASFTSNSKSKLSSKKIIAVGRLEYQKGFDLLIESFNQLNEKNKKDWILDIYGEGNCRKELQEKIDSLGLHKKINLMGSVNDIEKIYPDYSFFVFSSRFEGFGMALVEAMECGLPCISFDCPTGPREILSDGKFGLLIKNGDIKAFSDSMNLLTSSNDDLEKYSLLSKQRAADFNIDHILKKWLNILK